MRWMLASLIVGIILSVTCDARACEDYVVSRGTTIQSERPIAVLVVEAGLGVLHGNDAGRIGPLVEAGKVSVTSSRLAIDGEACLRPNWKAAVANGCRIAWKLVGFVLWDADGSIERKTTATVNGHVVHVFDSVTNGRVLVTVVIGPPLGDRRVKYAVLELEACDDGKRFQLVDPTVLSVACSVAIDLPGDRCRLVRRIAQRVAQQEAGHELRERTETLEVTGRRAILAGRSAMPAIIDRFLDEVCR